MSACNTTTFLDLSQAIDTHLGDFITNSEYRVLRFILSRTIRYNKTEERIPNRHFIEGVFSSSGEVVIAPIPMGRKTIYRCLESLKAKGLIAVALVGNDGVHLITLLVNRILECANMCALRLSRAFLKSRNEDHGSKLPMGMCQNDPQPCVKMTQRKEEIEGGDLEGGDSSFPGRKGRKVSESRKLGVEEVAEGIKRRYVARRTARAKAPKVFTTGTFRAVYNDAVSAYRTEHPSTPVARITAKEAGMFHNAQKNNSFYQNAEWADYITDCIANWDDYIRQLCIDWHASDLPLIPSFAFFLRTQSRYFTKIYAARQLSDNDRIQLRTDPQARAAAKEQRVRDQEAEKLRAETDALRDANRVLLGERRILATALKRKAQEPARKYTEEEIQIALSADLPAWADK